MTDEERKALVERLRSADMGWPETDEVELQRSDAHEKRIAELDQQVATVLAREAETTRRYDAKLDDKDAEIKQLREALGWYVAEDEKYIRAAMGAKIGD